MIYLDNAATSFPKLPEVIKAVNKCLNEEGANPGRGGYNLAVKAARVIFNTREQVARLFNIDDSANIAFTLNATDALNMAIKGLVKPGDHVVTTILEHNAVLRPLQWLEMNLQVAFTKVAASPEGYIDLKELEAAIRPDTVLIVANHASNVIGSILPIADIADIAHRRHIPILVDAAQTAGGVPIDIQATGIDMLAFTGHKALFGLQGTGGLYIREDLEVMESRQGGTGSDSSGPQPMVRPDRYESGTPNTPGLAGLGAGVEFILKEGVENIFAREQALIERLMAGFKGIPELTMYGPAVGAKRVPLVSVNLAGVSPHMLAHTLDKAFDIGVRAGLHCAPGAHQTIGTANTGTVRFGLNYLTTEDEVDAAIAALSDITKRHE